ncbi:unnamed protein product [Cercospora beticola]|nr:unnamed protein product [Cercospora beticola]
MHSCFQFLLLSVFLLLALQCSATCMPSGNTALGPCMDWCYKNNKPLNGQKVEAYIITLCSLDNCQDCIP